MDTFRGARQVVSLPAEALRRRGLPGADVPTGPCPSTPRGERRDHAALRHGQVHGAAQALDRRTHRRLAEPLPAPELGLGVPEPKRPSIPPVGVGSTDAAKALPFIHMILDGL